MIALWLTALDLRLIREVAKTEDVDWRVLAAIVYQESKGDPWTSRYEPAYRYTFNVHQFAHALVLSPVTEETFQKTSHGLVQIMGGTARDLGFKGKQGEIYKPRTNLTYGAKLLKRLTARYTDQDDVIASYNGGSPRRDTTGGLPPELQKYVSSVNDLLKDLL